MSEQPPRDEAQQPGGYTPASPIKRVLAWVGLVYMLAFVVLNVYPFFHGGRYLTGIAPLLLCPGAAGLLVLAVLTLRDKECLPSKRASMAVLALVCAVILVIGLVRGVPALLAGLGV